MTNDECAAKAFDWPEEMPEGFWVWDYRRESWSGSGGSFVLVQSRPQPSPPFWRLIDLRKGERKQVGIWELADGDTMALAYARARELAEPKAPEPEKVERAWTRHPDFQVPRYGDPSSHHLVLRSETIKFNLSELANHIDTLHAETAALRARVAELEGEA